MDRNISEAKSAAAPLFSQPWWLETVTPGTWSEVRVEHSTGATMARLPFRIVRRYGLTILAHPPLTPILGPSTDVGEGKYSTRLSNQHELLEKLIDGLPRYDLFVATCEPGITNILPFLWRGFSSSIHYTYRLSDVSDLDLAWSELTDSCRRAIRKARRSLTVRDDLTPDRFYDVVSMSWDRQRKKVPVSRDLVRRVYGACTKRLAGRVLSAVDADEVVHAVVLLVWDDRVLYYLMGGGNPDHRSSGAHSLLLWEAVRLASEMSLIFDFEGSSNPAIERFFRTFGAHQVPLFRIQRATRSINALLAARDMAEAVIGREIGPRL